MAQQYISMQLSADLAYRARVEAAKLSISRSEFVRRAIEAALRQTEPIIARREKVTNEQ